MHRFRSGFRGSSGPTCPRPTLIPSPPPSEVAPGSPPPSRSMGAEVSVIRASPFRQSSVLSPLMRAHLFIKAFPQREPESIASSPYTPEAPNL